MRRNGAVGSCRLCERGLWARGKYMPIYTPEKYTWTHADFDEVGWRNATLHAIAFMPGNVNISLDIDYAFEWIHPRTKK